MLHRYCCCWAICSQVLFLLFLSLLIGQRIHHIAASWFGDTTLILPDGSQMLLHVDEIIFKVLSRCTGIYLFIFITGGWKTCAFTKYPHTCRRSFSRRSCAGKLFHITAPLLFLDYCPFWMQANPPAHSVYLPVHSWRAEACCEQRVTWHTWSLCFVYSSSSMSTSLCFLSPPALSLRPCRL